MSSADLGNSTIVSLTFDDTHANNFQVGAMTEARGMRATFYVNSGRIGRTASMSLAQLETLAAAGHEISGHTISHARLTAVTDIEMQRQICADRVALLDLGFTPTTFAYPFSAQDSDVQAVARSCGYNAARIVGGLATSVCPTCPAANQVPPAKSYDIRTNGSVRAGTTLAQMQAYVVQAEQDGGGWVPFVFHHVCDGCSELAVSPATLAAFLDWLAAREHLGTHVATVAEVIGGDVAPGVLVPPPSIKNLLRNASLESDGNGDGTPDCWSRRAFGTNTGSQGRSLATFDGSIAERAAITSYTSGARRMISQQDSGACAPAVTPGRTYTASVSYFATTAPRFTLWYRNTAGKWLWLAQSATFPTSSAYRRASYTTPALPADATAISVGFGIFAPGTVTMDGFELVDPSALVDTTPPLARVAAPANGATVSGITAIAADVSDDVGVYRVRFYRDGVQLGSRVQTSYRWYWDTSTATVGPHTLAVQAEDAAGNVKRSANITVNVVR